MFKKSLLCLYLLSCALVSSAIAGPNLIPDPNIADTIRVDSIVAWTNGNGIVPVTFYNDESLAGIEMTITLDSPDAQIDSFSFLDGRLDYISVKGTFTHPNAITIYCIPFSAEPLVAPGDGLFGTLWLSWDLAIAPQMVTIDTITVINTDVEYATTFSDASSGSFVPQYQAGKVDIIQGTGCCIGLRGNVDNSPDQEPNVADLTFLVAYLFQGGPPPDCALESDLNGLDGAEPNVADLTFIVAYLFQGGADPVSCQ